MPTTRAATAAERRRLAEVLAMVFIALGLFGLSRLETRLFDLSEMLSKNQDFFTTVVYFGLINFNVILILALSFLIFRNVAKLVVERRRGVFGSNLRAKLVAALIFFAMMPTALLFYVSSRFIVTSFDEWFSDKVRTTMYQTREAGARVYKQDQRRLESLARIAFQRLRPGLGDDPLQAGAQLVPVGSLDGFDVQYGIDNVKVYDVQGQLVWASRDGSGRATTKVLRPGSKNLTEAHPASSERTEDGLARAGAARLAASPATEKVADSSEASFVLEALERFTSEPGLWSMSTVVGEDQQDVVKGVAPITNPATKELLGLVMTETRFETQILKSIEAIQQSFANLRPGAQLIKLSYLILLIMMTVLIVFSAVWLGFYVARGITGPIQSLAEGTREVALGNYNVTLEPKSDDETSQLVRSFNMMTHDLRRHRSQAEKARVALLESNDELERRRRYMETVLRNVAAGVIAASPDGKITSWNAAAERLLGVEAQGALGHDVRDALGTSLWESFWKPIEERLTSSEVFSAQVDITTGGRTLTLLVDGTRIAGDEGEDLGLVLVFDDATEQLKVQRVAAWREVARRIAHEIKNPITPIKLNAQRLVRRYLDHFEGEDREIFASCLDTILMQVDSLRDLVNEFSKFSRLPQVKLRLADVNEIIIDVASFFRGSYPQVVFDVQGLAPLPPILLDREQLNRVFMNLVTNAVEALDEKAAPGLIGFKSALVPSLNAVRIEIEDNGAGIPPQLRDRVLEPYYSTKDTGTGLGLAIVNQIVADHGGYLRLVANEPRGTRVVIELPLPADAARGGAGKKLDVIEVAARPAGGGARA